MVRILYYGKPCQMVLVIMVMVVGIVHTLV